jgi:hypothetical protein
MNLLHILLMDATITLGRHLREVADKMSAVDRDGVIHLFAADWNEQVLKQTNSRLPAEWQSILEKYAWWVGGCSAHAKCAR